MISFTLAGCRLFFRPAQIAYRNLRLRFQSLAAAAQQECLDQAACDCPLECCCRLLQPAWQEAVASLRHHGVGQSADWQLLWRYLVDHFEWELAGGVACGQAPRLLAEAVGQWSPAAVEGELAELLTLVPPDKPCRSSRCAGGAQSGREQAALAQLIYDNVLRLHWALLEILQRQGCCDYEPPTLAQLSTASQLQTQIAAATPGWQLPELCARMLTNDPYCPEHYHSCLAAIGDESRELERMCDFFGLPELIAWKLQLMHPQVKRALAATERTESERIFRQLVANCARMGLDPTHPLVELVERRLST